MVNLKFQDIVIRIANIGSWVKLTFLILDAKLVKSMSRMFHLMWVGVFINWSSPKLLNVSKNDCSVLSDEKNQASYILINLKIKLIMLNSLNF